MAQKFMLVQYYFPSTLSSTRLDKYLAAGWFRSGQALFRSELICLDEDIFTPVNIRLKLQEYYPKKKHRKIIRRNQKQFRTVVRAATVSEEKNILYQMQSERFKGFVFDSLAHFLQEEATRNVFDTWEVCVYDQEQLIAVSFFDKGVQSAASILGLNHQDPKYAKYSLGIYTMLMEVEHLKNEGKKFYYPGYILDKKSIFDYKLQLGKMYYYNWRGRWCNMKNLSQETLTVNIYQKAVEKLEEELRFAEIPYKKMFYPLFSLGYLDFFEEPFLTSITYFHILENETEYSPKFLVLAYNLEKEVYTISRVRRRKDYQIFINPHRAKDFQDTDLYCFDLLSEDEIVFEHRQAQETINTLKFFVATPERLLE